MIESIKWYLNILWNMMLKPMLFYQDMPEGKWSEVSLSFAIVTGWIMSFAITCSIFIIMYIPTGLNLIEGIKGKALIIVTPVIILMGIVFFVMTVLIVAVFLIAALLALLFAVAGILNFLLVLLGGNGNFYETLKAIFYSSGAFLVALFTIMFTVLVKWHKLSFADWLIGENVLFYTAAVYIFGLWSIAGRKVHNVPRWKAFLAAVFPLLVLIVFNMVFALKILPKIETWLT